MFGWFLFACSFILGTAFCPGHTAHSIPPLSAAPRALSRSRGLRPVTRVAGAGPGAGRAWRPWRRPWRRWRCPTTSRRSSTRTRSAWAPWAWAGAGCWGRPTSHWRRRRRRRGTRPWRRRWAARRARRPSCAPSAGGEARLSPGRDLRLGCEGNAGGLARRWCGGRGCCCRQTPRRFLEGGGRCWGKTASEQPLPGM